MTQNAPKILLVDKPLGITSYDVIRILKRRFRGLKIGHAGTLDPNATGLMIIGIGDGTKDLNLLLKLSKEYDAEILFGLQTDSGDVTGKTVAEKTIENFSEEALKNALLKITGKNEFTVPLYSAIKKDGKPLYAYARAGKEITLPKKEMEVFSVTLHGLENHDGKIIAKIHFAVASGTYIRTLAEELGILLKIPATLKNLRRTRIGDFHIKDAEKIN